jgi:thiol:disulfide interchange protein DsbD
MGVIVHAAPNFPSSPVTFDRAIVSPTVAHPGEVVTVSVTAHIAKGWHVYSVVPSPNPGPFATTVTLSGEGLTQAGGPRESWPHKAFDSNFQTDVQYHESSARFSAATRIPAGSNGKVDATIAVRYQACNDHLCNPPMTFTRDVSFTVAPGAVREEYTPVPPLLNLASSTQSVSTQVSTTRTSAALAAPDGLGAFIGFAFVAGLLALLTPCVFPLIPVTFGYFTKEAHGERRKLIELAAAYAVGIVLSFVALGLIATVTLGAAGPNRVAANPWINAGFGVLFVVLAFAFFETFNLQLPQGLSKLAASGRGKGGLVGVLLMGLAFVFTAFTCTAPFIASVLATAATVGGGYLRPVVGMVVFSSALALPFFLIALFPPLLTRLPKSGAWLSRMKAVLGFVELAYAVLYFSKADLVWQAHVFTRPVIFGIWAVIFVCGALYLIGALRVNAYPDEPAKVTLGRAIGIALFGAAAVYCFYAMSGRPINRDLAAFVPEAEYGVGKTASVKADDSWLDDYDAALVVAKRENKPIFIDFTGYTCTNCRWMEQNIFPKPEVASRLAQFVRVRLYTDGGPNADRNQVLQLKIGKAIAQPLYALMGPDGSEIGISVGIESNPKTFASFLDKALTTPSTAPFYVPASKPSAPAAAQWAPYTDDEYRSALAAGRPIVIDFTASWCVPCHAIDKQVFQQADVKAKLASFTTLRADLSDFDSAPNRALEAKFGVQQLPTVVVLDPQGKELPGTRITGILTPQEFLARLAKGE